MFTSGSHDPRVSRPVVFEFVMTIGPIVDYGAKGASHTHDLQGRHCCSCLYAC